MSSTKIKEVSRYCVRQINETFITSKWPDYPNDVFVSGVDGYWRGVDRDDLEKGFEHLHPELDVSMYEIDTDTVKQMGYGYQYSGYCCTFRKKNIIDYMKSLRKDN